MNDVNETPKNKAWNDYWRHTGASGNGCLPGANETIETALSSWWSGFATKLPKNARHIDLASGNGIVIRKMLKARGDLKSTGIDLATSLPPAGKGYKLRGGISMEAMPFPDNSVDAITSQFGIEYGDIAKISLEICRLLKSGGHFGFVIHKSDGPIVTQNKLRLESIHWVLTQEKLLIRAQQWLCQRLVLGNMIPPDFVNAPQISSAKFGATSAAAEISTALLQCLSVGANLPLSENIKMIDDLSALALGEIARINSLQDAALDRQDVTAVCENLENLGLTVKISLTLSELMPECDDFAWIVSGRKF